MLTLAVTSASTERANSTLKFIKTKLRSTISQLPLNAFVLAYKHKDILYQISNESLRNQFIAMKNRRLSMQNPISDQTQEVQFNLNTDMQMHMDSFDVIIIILCIYYCYFNILCILVSLCTKPSMSLDTIS